MTELDVKTERLRAWMAEKGLQAFHVTRAANVAWLAGGARAYVDTATDAGVASILVTATERFVLTDNIEERRLSEEERLSDGFQLVAGTWHAPDDALGRLTGGITVGSDLDLDLAPLRTPLLPVEAERYRALGSAVGIALEEVAAAIAPGMAEHAVAGLLARAVYDLGGVPVVVQVAADDRAWRYRHALPTGARVERTVLFGLCARRAGLVVSASRLVAFEGVSEELANRVAAVCAIDAAARAATRPGVTMGSIFDVIRKAYGDVGFRDEWRNHHQGGPCSYGARDLVVRPQSPEIVSEVQAFAWNPTVPGAKSEDTVLCTEAGCENLTRSPSWPQNADGNDILRR